MSPVLMTTGWTLDTVGLPPPAASSNETHGGRTAPVGAASDPGTAGASAPDAAVTFESTWIAALGEPAIGAHVVTTAGAVSSSTVSSEAVPVSTTPGQAPRASRERRKTASDSAADEASPAPPVSVPLAYLTAPVYSRAPAWTETAGTATASTPVVAGAPAGDAVEAQPTYNPAQVDLDSIAPANPPATAGTGSPATPVNPQPPSRLPATAGAPRGESAAAVFVRTVVDEKESQSPAGGSRPDDGLCSSLARNPAGPNTSEESAPEVPLPPDATGSTTTPATHGSGISTPAPASIGEFSIAPEKPVSAVPVPIPADPAPETGSAIDDPVQESRTPDKAGAAVSAASTAAAAAAAKAGSVEDGGLAFAVRLSGDSQAAPRSADPVATAPLTASSMPAPRSDARPADASANTRPAATAAAPVATTPAAAGHAADTVQPAEPPARVDNSNEAPLPEAARQISVRIPGPGDQSAFVRLSQRGSDVVVSVRGSDANLVDSLRAGLPALSTRLESHDVRAEVWQPAGGSPSQSGQDRRGDSSRQNQTGDTGGQSQQQQQPQDRRGRERPDWLDAMEGLASQVPGRRS